MITLSEASPAAIASAALELLGDSDLRDRRQSAGIAYCDTHPIAIEQIQFAEALDEILKDDGGTPALLPKKSYTGSPFQASEKCSQTLRKISYKNDAREKAAHKATYLQNAGIIGDSFEMVIDGIQANQNVSNPEVFIWSKEGQSDIVRLPLAKDDSGQYSCIFTPDPETFEKSIYHIHAHAGIDGPSQLIAITDVLLFGRSETTDLVESETPTLLDKLAATKEHPSAPSEPATIEIDIQATDVKSAAIPAEPAENTSSASRRITSWIKRRKR